MRNRAMVPEPLTPGLNSVHLVQLHAGKHDPIAYFEDVRRDRNPWLSWAQMPAFDRSGGLWGDLAGGRVSAFSFIVPTAFCNFDPDDRGTRAGVNPAPIIVGHRTLQKMVNAIQASPRGNNAIVVVWDELGISHQFCFGYQSSRRTSMPVPSKSF